MNIMKTTSKKEIKKEAEDMSLKTELEKALKKAEKNPLQYGDIIPILRKLVRLL